MIGTESHRSLNCENCQTVPQFQQSNSNSEARILRLMIDVWEGKLQLRCAKSLPANICHVATA
eukprot:12626786-Prorocentrum_lima.AAC.1